MISDEDRRRIQLAVAGAPLLTSEQRDLIRRTLKPELWVRELADKAPAKTQEAA